MIYNLDNVFGTMPPKYFKIRSGPNLYWVDVNRVSNIDVSNEKQLLEQCDYAIETQYKSVLKCKGGYKDFESLIDALISANDYKPVKQPTYRTGDITLQQYRDQAAQGRLYGNENKRFVAGDDLGKLPLESLDMNRFTDD